MATADGPVESVDDELRELVDVVFRHPPSVQLLAYVLDHDGRAVTTPARLRPWMTEGQFEYAFDKLVDAKVIEKQYSERGRYGARDPPREAVLTDHGKQVVSVAKDGGYRTDLWRRAEEVQEAQREVDRLTRRIQRMEEMLTAEDLEGTDVTLGELVDHVVELEDYVYEWTEVAERHLDALWETVDEG